MNDLTMTVNGWVATQPAQHVGPSGVRLTSFRMASTSRYYDREKQEWVDGRTEWFSVKVFRNAAITVANSIHKGQPVVVHGRFRTSEWEGDSGTRVDLVIDATSVGHDLTRGTADFSRAVGDGALGEPEAPADPPDVEAIDAAGSEVGDENEDSEKAEELALSA